jgi:hypothetical protein
MARILAFCAAAYIATLADVASAGDFASTGQVATINRAGNGFPCFETPFDFDAFWNAKAAGDKYGMSEAMQSAITLRAGWRIRMLGSDSGSRHSKVRVESGPKAGIGCWVKYNPAGMVDL